MSSPSKPALLEPFEESILDYPKPQATSTVKRRSILPRLYESTDVQEKSPKHSATFTVDGRKSTTESSLGIIDNISMFLTEVSDFEDIIQDGKKKIDAERELARKLLQRCSDLKNTNKSFGNPSTNKESNTSVQNVTDTMNDPSTIVEQEQSIFSNQISSKNNSTVQPSINKTSPNSVVFEPNEITARSSGLSRNSEKPLSESNQNSNAITFDTTTAELLAQFNDEEFRSGSQMDGQLSADEASWKQNYSYAVPTTAAEKDYLNLSCFSGIIGELDLSIESCAGHKMTVDDFFRRKCGNMGRLSTNEIDERPSIGLPTNSPIKRGKIVPLIDQSLMTEASSSIASYALKDSTHQISSNMTKDVEEQSIMSLSSIAKALQDIDSGTPRKLVDQLIMAKKARKTMQLQKHYEAQDQVTLPLNRTSMPVIPSANVDTFEKDLLLNLSTKLSLDSKVAHEANGSKQHASRMLSFDTKYKKKADETFPNSCEELHKELINKSRVSACKQDLKYVLLTPIPQPLSFSAADQNLEKSASQINSEIIEDNRPSNLESKEISKIEVIKKENVSYKDDVESIPSVNINLQTNRDVVIGRSTELCNCVVGMYSEYDLELLNKGDRWVICSLSLNEVQGDKENIRLRLQNGILINPNAVQCTKIGVKVVKMCKPIIAVLNITVADMVTRSAWVMKHIICFKPEEFNIHIPGLTQKEELDFQCIVENSIAILPITVENRNNINIPLKLSIIQNEHSIFSIDNSSKFKCFTLKPEETFSTSIQCKGILPNTVDKQSVRLHRYEARLIIETDDNVDANATIREVPLVVQVGTCKVQVINTEIPIIIPNKQSKPLTLVNLGSATVSITASFVQDPEYTKVVKDFLIHPENLVLQCDETGCFFITYKPQSSDPSKKYIKVKIAVGNSTYYYSVIGECNSIVEENENMLRCATPQNFSPISSPTSPLSVTSSRHESGHSGRQSPISSISSSTVAGDKIPIRATHAALVWNSLKTGRSEIKEFFIRNTSNNKIKIQATITDNGDNFRFIRDRYAVGAIIVLALQKFESRTLSVVFSPRNIGAAIGKICFRHYESKKEDTESRPSKIISLYGYGGHSKVEISEAFKDISGKMTLPLGTLYSEGPLNAKIKLQNNGDLCSYVKVKLTLKGEYRNTVPSWHIHPTEFLLNPKEIQWVTVEFRPRKKDIAPLQRAIFHVGTITVTHGDEPTRWRIRRIYNKLKQAGELHRIENDALTNIVQPICKSLNGEQLISDLVNIRDSAQNFKELCNGVYEHEIMLTMEVCADETLSILDDNADETQMFYSLCSDESHVHDGRGDSYLHSETSEGRNLHYEVDDNNIMVSPSIVNLCPTKSEAIVTIRSSYTVAQPFETQLSNSEYLSVIPAEGMIPTRRDFQLRIRCKQKIEHNFNAMLEVYTKNNKQNIQIRVKC